MPDLEKYPVSVKLSKARGQRMAIYDFLEWLENEKGIIVDRSDALIMEYLGIDEKALEAERRAMLREYQQ